MFKKLSSSFFKHERNLYFAYSLILLLPIISSFVSFFYVEHILEEKVENTSLASLQVSQAYIDNAISNIVSATVSLARSKGLEEISSQNIPTSATERYAITKLNSIWKSHDIFLEHITHKMIYFPRTDTIYTGKTILTANNCYQWYFAENNLTLDGDEKPSDFNLETFKTKILNCKQSDFVSFHTASGMKLFYVYPVYQSTYEDIVYSVFVELDLNHLLSQSHQSANSSFFISWPNGNILHRSLTDDERDAASALTLSNQFFKIERGPKGKFVVMRANSITSEWSYGVVMPLSEYQRTLPKTKEFMYICTAFFIFLGLILVFRLVKRIFAPLRLLSAMLSTSHPASEQLDIYTNIINQTKMVLDSNKQLTLQLDSQTNVLKSTILSNILYGKTKDKLSYTEQLKMLGITMDKELFAVITLMAKDFSFIFGEKEAAEISKEEKIQLSNLIIGNVFSEILSCYYTAELVATDSFIVIIVNYSADVQDLKKSLTEIFHTANKIFQDEFSFHAAASVSSSKLSLDGLSTSYRESLLGLEYLRQINDDLIFYEDIIADRSNTSLDMTNLQQSIQNFLENKDYKNCRKAIEESIYNFQRISNITPEMARIFACDLLRVFLQSDLISASNKTKSFLISAEYDRILAEESTVSNILLRTLNVIDTYLTDYIEISHKTSAIEIYQQIKDYINIHYSDQNLSVAEIAERFNISAAYLSSQFKKNYKIGLLDYINHVRIDAAKEQLINTNMKNEDIANYVGYTNVRTFLRTFSKIEGVTPKEYRAINYRENQ